MKAKRKKLNGFTLLELIIVMAIFSGIVVGAMAMIKPAMQLFNKTSSQETAGADIDNISRYLQDNLRYADRVNIYYGWGFKNINEFLNNSFIEILPSFEKNDSTKIISKKYINATPLEFFKKYYYSDDKPDSFFNDKNVNIMEIDKNGFITIYIYSLKTQTEISNKTINPEYYNDYKFSITNWTFNPPELNIKMNIEYNGITKGSDGKNKKLNQESQIGIIFSNIDVRSNFNVVESILNDGYIVSPGSEDEFLIKDNVLNTTPANSYKIFKIDESDVNYKEGNTYLVYTTPAIIIP